MTDNKKSCCAPKSDPRETDSEPESTTVSTEAPATPKDKADSKPQSGGGCCCGPTS